MKHRAWNVKLEQLLAGNEVDLDKQSARKNNVCPLGKWLYGDGQKFAHLNEMKDLINLHSEMHEVVGRVIDAYDLNDMDMANREKDRVHNLSNKIIATIDLVKHHVAKDTAAAKASAKNSHSETPKQITKPVAAPAVTSKPTSPKPLPKTSKPAKRDDEWDDF
jgi:methyl-accepting chemotaxis protein